MNPISGPKALTDYILNQTAIKTKKSNLTLILQGILAGMYIAIGAVVWFCFLNAGIHPTIAGVLVAFCVPAKQVFAPINYVRTIRKNIGYFAHEDDERLISKTILS